MILRSNGIITVDSIPTHIPVGNEATLAHLEGTSTFYYFDTSNWITLTLTEVSDDPYVEAVWDGITDVAPSKNAVRDAIEALVAGVLPDGDYGSVTVSGLGTVITIDTAAVTLAMLANIATDKLIGRDTAGAGVPEVIGVTGGLEF